MALKIKTRKELIETAKMIVERQFPGEWERFLQSGLDDMLDTYFLLMETPDVDPDEEFENFKLGVFEAAKMLHEENFF